MISDIDFKKPFYILLTLSIFGIWKIIEILIWLTSNIDISIKVK